MSIKLSEILNLIDDIEEIAIFKSYKYNQKFAIKKTKEEFIKSELYKKYKDCEVKGIYPESTDVGEVTQCIIIK